MSSVQLNIPTTLGAKIASTLDGDEQHQQIVIEKLVAGVPTPIDSSNTLPVTDATLAAKDFATQTTLAAVLAKLIANPATQATLAALLTELQLKADLTETQPVSAASLPLPSGAATAANQQTNALTDAQLRATPVPVSGTVTANTGLSQPLTDTQLRATPVPVSGTVTVDTSLLATQATLASVLAKIIAAPATEAKQDNEITQLTALNAKDFATQTTLAAFYAALGLAQGSDATSTVGPMVQGLVNDVPSSYLAGQVHPLSLTAEGRLRVSAVPADTKSIWNNIFDDPFYDKDLYASSLNFFY